MEAPTLGYPDLKDNLFLIRTPALLQLVLFLPRIPMNEHPVAHRCRVLILSVADFNLTKQVHSHIGRLFYKVD